MTGRAYIFAGGGTGGHIYPAIAIAEVLRKDPQARAVFICSDRPLDERLLERAVVDGQADGYTPIPARPFGLRLKSLARLAGSWGVCVRRVREIINAEKQRAAGEDGVTLVAMGGFVSAPAVQAARAERCPVVLVNLDATAGLANRWIARRADHRFAVVRSPDRPTGLEWDVVNPIVRRAVLDAPPVGEARVALGLDPDTPMLLVTGGSQGARTINAFMAEFVRAHGDALRRGGWQVLHQCGHDQDNESLASMYTGAGIKGIVAPTILTMGVAWAAADLAVARAGAGTVAEVWATGTPALLLPYPYHADAHQRLNAAPLVECGGVVPGEDLIDATRNLDAHGEALRAMIDGPEKRSTMRASLRALGPADGAASIGATLLAK